MGNLFWTLWVIKDGGVETCVDPIIMMFYLGIGALEKLTERVATTLLKLWNNFVSVFFLSVLKFLSQNSWPTEIDLLFFDRTTFKSEFIIFGGAVSIVWET